MSESSSGGRGSPAIDRRAFLQAAGGVAAGTLAASKIGLAAATAEVPMFESKVDFRNPVWNRDTYARLQGNLDLGKEKIGWYNGVVLGVVPGEAARPLVRFDGFSVCRLTAVPDGYRKLLREVVLYRDVRSGQLLEQWTNPWTNEVVPVVNVANDPFNYSITLHYPEPPSYRRAEPGEATEDPVHAALEGGGRETAADDRHPPLLSERAAARQVAA